MDVADEMVVNVALAEDLAVTEALALDLQQPQKINCSFENEIKMKVK